MPDANGGDGGRGYSSPSSSPCACGGTVVHDGITVDGVRTDRWLCDACGCGLKWRRRIVRARPAPAPIGDLDAILCDAAGYIDGARHKLIAAARAASDAATLGLIEQYNAEAAELAVRIAALVSKD